MQLKVKVEKELKEFMLVVILIKKMKLTEKNMP